MSLGKKELRMIAFLGLLLYAVIFYKFAWVPIVPQRAEINRKLLAAADEKASLEQDLKNLDKKKMELSAKETSNERMDEYLMNSANMVDSLEYVDKLTGMIGKNITELKIAQPEERYAVGINYPLSEDTDLKTESNAGKRYYEIKMDFKAYMPYGKALELVQYVEGGTRRVKITKFAVKPFAGSISSMGEEALLQTDSQTDPQSQQDTGEKLFEVNMTISMFSINLRASDRIYEYSRHKLNRFIDGNGMLFDSAGSSGDAAGVPTPVDISQSFGKEDIIIKERSYLAAGENLQIFGADRENDIIRVKTNKATDVKIQLSSTSYSIDATDSEKKNMSISGGLPEKNLLTMYIGVDMPAIKENQKICLNVSITNNSDKNINIFLYDKQKRVRILNRQGAEIIGTSSVEKVSVI